MSVYDGKRVVITGGTGGIGLATARLLAAGGARVLVTGRTPASVAAARAELGPAAIVAELDARTGIDALADRAATAFGGVDALVLNAGATLAASVDDTTPEQFDEIFDINAKAPFFTLQKFIPLLAPGSAVVLTTSVSNTKGIPSTSVYSATKAALRSLTRTFAGELIGRGIRVNASPPAPPTPASSRSRCPPRRHNSSSKSSGPPTRCSDSPSPRKWRRRSSSWRSTRPTPPVPNCSSTVARSICDVEETLASHVTSARGCVHPL